MPEGYAQPVPLSPATVRAWRLSIIAVEEGGGVPMGTFNWPWALGLALDEVDRLKAALAEVEPEG